MNFARTMPQLGRPRSTLKLAQARRVLVTGAASGIGAATCELLEGRGAEVLGVDLRGAAVEADLSQPAGRREVVSQTEERFDGALDAVILCGGSAAQTAATLDFNYFGVVDLLEGLHPALARGNAPRAVVVASAAVAGIRTISWTTWR